MGVTHIRRELLSLVLHVRRQEIRDRVRNRVGEIALPAVQRARDYLALISFDNGELQSALTYGADDDLHQLVFHAV